MDQIEDNRHSKSLLKMKLVEHNWTENVHIISEMVSFIFLLY